MSHSRADILYRNSLPVRVTTTATIPRPSGAPCSVTQGITSQHGERTKLIVSEGKSITLGNDFKLLSKAGTTTRCPEILLRLWQNFPNV